MCNNFQVHRANTFLKPSCHAKQKVSQQRVYLTLGILRTSKHFSGWTASPSPRGGAGILYEDDGANRSAVGGNHTMKDISDISKFDWIQERVLPPVGNSKFGHLIPQGFEAYCKIFHSAFEDLDISDKTRSWKDVDVASSEYKHLASRKLVHGINFNGRRVRLKDLAENYKIPLTHKGVNELTRQVFWLTRYVTTNEGEMDFQTASNLSRVLAGFTTEKIYYFSFYGWEKDLQILEGNLDEGIMNIESKKSVPGSPTFWWASDKSWCIALDYDSNFSLCGSSIETINALTNDSELECLRIDINDDYC